MQAQQRNNKDIPDTGTSASARLVLCHSLVRPILYSAEQRSKQIARHNITDVHCREEIRSTSVRRNRS